MRNSLENRGPRRKKILLVDDEPVNIKVMSQILMDSYRIMVAIGGQEALKCAVSSQPPDLILLDLVMPGMDGIEVCRQLKASHSTRNIPVIIVTGRAEEYEIAEAIEAGAVDCVRKPVHPELLKVRVASQLALRRCRSRGSQGHDIVAAALQQEKEANFVLKAALRRAEEDLEASRQYRHMFLAEMHHEIKTHLTTIVGMAGLALRKEIPPSVREFLCIIQKATDTLVDLINDIVDLSLLEEGDKEVCDREFSPTLLINDVCDACGELAIKKGVELVVDTSPELPALLWGSAPRIRQLLIQLVHFTIKRLRGSEILLKTGGDFTDSERFILECAISCRDSSLTDKEARALFVYADPLEDTRDRCSVSTGLGLPICRRIVENMSGRIDVSTTPQSGVTFTCSLPLECIEKEPVFSHFSHRLMEGLHVLLADDSPLAAEVIAGMLASAGCRVDAVQSWEEVLERCLGTDRPGGEPEGYSPYDLIVLDWTMPGMDGSEIIRRLRTGGIALPAIITGVPALLMMSMVHEAGTSDDTGLGAATGFIMKPVKRDALFEKIHDLFSPDSVKAKHAVSSNMGKNNRGLAGLKALLVEDNAINRQIAGQLLEMAGMQVTGAATGNSAVECASRTLFDVILMDIELPDINGIEVVRLIRKIPSCRQVPVIALTAHSWASHRKAYQEAGMKFCIEKPIDPDELYAILKDAVTYD